MGRSHQNGDSGKTTSTLASKWWHPSDSHHHLRSNSLTVLLQQLQAILFFPCGTSLCVIAEGHSPWRIACHGILTDFSFFPSSQRAERGLVSRIPVGQWDWTNEQSDNEVANPATFTPHRDLLLFKLWSKCVICHRQIGGTTLTPTGAIEAELLALWMTQEEQLVTLVNEQEQSSI